MRSLDVSKVLIVTNRPAIANSWFDDFTRFIGHQTTFRFVSESPSLDNRSPMTREQWRALSLNNPDEDLRVVEFLPIALLVALWLMALAFGPDAYATFTGWMGSPLGLLVWFGLTVALFLHLAGGLRHLVWDTGKGLSPRAADRMAWASIIVGVGGAVVFWVLLFTSGRVVL